MLTPYCVHVAALDLTGSVWALSFSKFRYYWTIGLKGSTYACPGCTTLLPAAKGNVLIYAWTSKPIQFHSWKWSISCGDGENQLHISQVNPNIYILVNSYFKITLIRNDKSWANMQVWISPLNSLFKSVACKLSVLSSYEFWNSQL